MKNNFDISLMDTCCFCHNAWGYCQCSPTITFGIEGFEHCGITITEPNVSECGRFLVDPTIYYGNDYINWENRRQYIDCNLDNINQKIKY